MKSGRDGKHDEFERLLATAHRGRMHESSACPDAATVAAYVDDGLDAGERVAFERHAADCPRCAEAMALVAGLDDAPEVGATTPRTSTWPWWRLLVPVATVLIVLLVWRELPPRESGTPVSDTSDSMPAAPPPAGPEQHAATSARAPHDEPKAKGAQRKSPPLVRPQQQEDKQTVERRQMYAAPPSPTSAGAAARPEGGTRPPQAARERQNEAIAIEPPPAPPAPLAEADSAAQRPDERLSKVTAPLSVLSADSAVLYRVVDGRTVQRSTDSGRTWVTESTPAVTALRVASAPSRDICWFAGAEGVILRRNPGGTWQLVSLPEPLEIVGITATTATDATVTTANGMRWQTTDGGKRWEQLDRGL